MRALALLLVLLLPLLAGCAKPGSSSADASSPADGVALSLFAEPQVVDGGASPSTLAWSIDARSNGTHAPGAVQIELSVIYNKRRDMGADRTDADVPASGAVVKTLRSAYAGFGDYAYTIVARDRSAHELGRAADVWHKCPFLATRSAEC